MAAISLARPPSDFIARPDDLELASTAGRFEIGNFNLPATHALGAALDLIEAVGINNIRDHCFDLGDQLIEGLDKLGVGLVGPRDRALRAPHIYVAALPAEEWVPFLADNGIRVSPERDGIRISLGMFNKLEDIDRLLGVAERKIAARSSKAA